MQVSKLDRLDSFITLDGSSIRELAGPAWTAARNQSLAEARVPAGSATIEHFHRESEEIYYFVSGRGRMRLGDEEVSVGPGDCVVIRRGCATSSGPPAMPSWFSCAAARPPTPTPIPR